ncbi:MAG: nidogen-like domain-containing protein [Polyangiales bacterium]
MNARALLALAALAACTPRTTGNVIPFLDGGDEAAAVLDAAPVDATKTPTDNAAPDDRPAPTDVVTADVPAPIDLPETPDVPVIADVPVIPDVPVVTDVPVIPDVPVVTDVPVIPDVPVVADAGPSCRSDRDCSGSGQVCDATRMVCVDCIRDVDCLAPNTVCLSNRCAPRVACTTSRMCPGQVCDTARMLCVDCLAPVDCAPGQTCQAGSCVTPMGACTSNSQCPGQVCNTATGRCVACLGPSDCGSGQTCRDNACVTLACMPGAVSCASATSVRRCSLDGMSESVTACPGAPGAEGRCALGTCTVACLTGFGDCDGNLANGCEANLNSSTAHCGRCGNACTPVGDGGVAACSAGRCALSCSTGRGDCDGNAGNGCETDTTNSTAHCGACGNVCPSGRSCVAGACQVMLRGLGGSTGFGPDVNCLQGSDDGSYTANGGGVGGPVAIPLGGSFGPGLNYYGTTHTSFFVNTNGNISFGQALSAYTPSPFPSSTQPIIAPWWADVDTRGGGRPARNNICWALDSGRLVVTWDRVGYYASHDDRQNSFQIVIRNRADVRAGDFDVEFRYERCAWTTGDANGGTGGLGGTPAQVGFDAGDRTRSLSHPSSRTSAVLDLCRTSNVGDTGVWRYLSRNGVMSPGP